MAAHARKAEQQDGAHEAEVAAHAPVPTSVARVLALQASAGNAAVARMISLLPSAGVARAPAAGRTLARLLDYDGLAERIHEATDRLGTDEAAIMNALRQLNRDPAEVDQLLAAYQRRFGEDMIAVLNSELSGADLQTAMFLLRRAPSPGMQAVAAEMESMVGQQATWTGSGPGSGNTFETWASAASESAAPPLSTVTSINCWEMVLLAAYRAGLLTWQWIHDQYTAAVGYWGAYMVNMLSRGARIPYSPRARRAQAARGRPRIHGRDEPRRTRHRQRRRRRPRRRHLVLAAAEHAVHARRHDRQRQAHDDRGARRLVGGQHATRAARRARRAAVVVAEIRATLPAEARTESVPQGSLLGAEPSAMWLAPRLRLRPDGEGLVFSGTSGRITLHRLDGSIEQVDVERLTDALPAADGTWLLDAGSLRHGAESGTGRAGSVCSPTPTRRTRSRGGRRRWSRASIRRVGTRDRSAGTRPGDGRRRPSGLGRRRSLLERARAGPGAAGAGVARPRRGRRPDRARRRRPWLPRPRDRDYGGRAGRSARLELRRRRHRARARRRGDRRPRHRGRFGFGRPAPAAARRGAPCRVAADRGRRRVSRVGRRGRARSWRARHSTAPGRFCGSTIRRLPTPACEAGGLPRPASGRSRARAASTSPWPVPKT